jgi:4-hydroxy 2-oxovalerate aldolase
MILTSSRKIKIIDCTLRDGGYYNNWNFSKKLIQDYIHQISKTNICYIELGFRFFKKKKPLGLTAYTADKLIDSLNIPNKLNIGIMINAGELVKNKKNTLSNLKKLFPSINKKIKFVRFACHFDEVFFLKSCISWLKENKIEVFINIMQSSELGHQNIKKISLFLKNTDIKSLYIADSLGALNATYLLKIIKKFKQYWPGQMGLHAHNNLNLALDNSIVALKNNVNWIDSTILGMGRGPGNLLTEEIFKFLNYKNNSINRLKNNYFKQLKDKYKWGPNKYYRLAAIYKIHPSYIQEILSDKKQPSKNYIRIINNLKKMGAKKYKVTKLLSAS